MTLIFILFIFFVVYSAIVRATYLKFRNNGIKFNLKYKFFVTFLPLFIFFVHLKLAAKEFQQDKKKSGRIIIIAITKYPIILGNLIEVILESMAECNVYGTSKFLKIKPKKELAFKHSFSINDMSFKIREVLSFLKRDSNYEKELLAGLAN